MSRPFSGFSRVDPEPDIEVADTGRKEDFPTCPIIFVMGMYMCKVVLVLASMVSLLLCGFLLILCVALLQYQSKIII